MSSTPQLSRAPAPAVSWLDKPWVPPALICGLVCLVYVATLRFQFVYDDNFQIVDNPWLSWHYIPQYFSKHVWAFADLTGMYWRPLFLLWLLAQHAIFGVNPAGWHAATVLLHALAAVLVYAVAHRLTRDRAAAVIAALIFGVHPVLIESTAWVSGSTDTLLACCLLAAFLAFFNWRIARVSDSSDPQPSRRWLAISLALYVLALMAKEPAVMLLPLIFLFAWLRETEAPWPRRGRSAFAAVLPYLPITLIYAVFHRVIAARMDTAGHPATPANMLFTAPSLLLFYLRLLVFPWPVSPEYPLDLVPHFGVRSVLLPVVALIAIALAIYACVRRLRRRGEHDAASMVWFASAWMVLPILPVLYMTPLSAHDFAHARYLYLPCVGFALLLALAIRRLPIPQAATAGAIILLLALGTVTQQVHWASNLLLFSHGVRVAPQNPVALTRLGIEMGKRHEYDKALALLHAAVRHDPWDYYANFNLGYTYFMLGRFQEAEPYLDRGVKTRPMDMDPDGFVYLGMVEMKLGDLAKAEWAVRQAAHRRPEREKYRYALALIFEQEGKLADAAQEFQATLAINPANADARARLARAQSTAQ